MKQSKAVFKNVSENFRVKFNYSKCLLTISVGQEVHETDKFEATIDLVNNSFNSCIMMIDDSLQRHTMALDSKFSPEYFYPISLEEGKLWLERNQPYLNKLTILENIVHWDYWLNHPRFQILKTDLKNELACDEKFNAIFNLTIDEFLCRYYDRLIQKENFDMKRGRKLCMDYLVEECTAMRLWPELKCQFEVYPSKRNFAMDETHKRYVLPHYPELLRAVALKFKNKKQLKPQQFNYFSDTAHAIESIG